MGIAKNGRDVITEGKRGGDEYGKGILGKHPETDAIQKEDQDHLGEISITYGGGHFENEKAGLEDGVSARMDFDVDEVEPEYNYAVDTFTGNAPERKVGRVNNTNVSGKGKKFWLGEI